MKNLSISLLAVLLITLAACGDVSADNKIGAAASVQHLGSEGYVAW